MIATIELEPKCPYYFVQPPPIKGQIWPASRTLITPESSTCPCL